MNTSISPARLWSGRVLTGFAALFFAFDGVTKVLRIAPVLQASRELGVPESSIVGIGVLLLACTALYCVPRTAILGAVLLVGYLGGAIAIQVRAGGAAFPIVFALTFGVIVWGGLLLRRPELAARLLT
jgi:hypothetical protein